MDKDKIWSHISRKISGEDTDEDDRLVDEWLNDKPANKQIYARLTEIWNFREPSSKKYHSLFEALRRRITVFENRPEELFYTTTAFKAAAILAIILLSNFLVYFYQEKSKPDAIVTYQEIIVPRGNRMKVVLADSTSIWLNNETKLKYSSNFSSTNREVELSGEGYFDVHHDANHPFVVKVGKQRIQVLGTRFSINAYPDDEVIETSLLSGSVAFQYKNENNGNAEVKLDPGYSLFYNKKDNRTSTQKIQSSYYQYWENGVYAFKDERLEDLSVKIKRIFNVELVFEDKFLSYKTYTGTISINDNIYVFMEAIRRTSVEPIEYKFNKNIIYVKLKK
jgi:ferric-dicitrate binding protein FerR (iron transport regulator)